MAKYIALYKWTEQGVKNVKDTVKRANDAKKLAEQMNGRMLNVYWTQGLYDIVVIYEFPDDETASAMALAQARLGNVRSETMRAFDEGEMERISQKLS